MSEPRHTSLRRMDALDGVRTLAVALVILFHVSAPGLAAGFIGVDIFFVLSGYLITSGLVRDVERTGRIDLAGFWTRRFKRLLPAVLLVLAAVAVWMLTVAPLYDRAGVAADLWWTLLYVANWHLMAANSYFADTGTTSPLLHMWSLAVEEQFYLVWPLVLLGCLGVARRRAGRFLRVALVVAVVLIVGSAILLAVLHDPESPDRAYMGTDTKAFEPLLGAAAAIALRHTGIRSLVARRHRLLSAGGLALMAVLFPFLAGPADFYYGWGAVAFSLGALALVVGLAQAGGQGVLARGLGWGPVAYLGRISYGLYLWHWPVSLWVLGDREGFDLPRALVVIAITVGAAALSYHLVEMPVRTGRWFTPARTALASGAAVATMLAVVSLGGGTPLSPVTTPLVAKEGLDRRVVLVVGDSVPQRFNAELEKAARAQGLRIASGTAGGCAPSGQDVPLTPGDPDVVCGEVLERQAQALEQFAPATVVWWSRYELADRRVDGQVLTPDDEAFWAQTEAELRTTAERLTAGGRTLVIVETDRIGQGIYSRCSEEKCHPFLDRLAHDDEHRLRWNAMVAEYARATPGVETVAVDDLYCTDDAVPCDDTHDGVPARSDGSHFSDPAVMPDIAAGVMARVVEAAGL